MFFNLDHFLNISKRTTLIAPSLWLLISQTQLLEVWDSHTLQSFIRKNFFFCQKINAKKKLPPFLWLWGDQGVKRCVSRNFFETLSSFFKNFCFWNTEINSGRKCSCCNSCRMLFCGKLIVSCGRMNGIHTVITANSLEWKQILTGVTKFFFVRRVLNVISWLHAHFLGSCVLFYIESKRKWKKKMYNIIKDKIT